MHLITQSCVLLLWMQTLTFVKSEDCTLADFINGDLFDSKFDTSNMEASYASGKQVRVGCLIGHSGFFKLTCVGGKWDSKGTPCQPRSCGHPGDAQFAEFNLEKGDDFVFGSQVVYTCQKGYQMVSRTNVRRCMAAGWDGVVPVCEAQQCPVIHVDKNVLVNGDPEEATFGNVVRFSCKSRNEVLAGSSEMYCDENGEWSGERPKCIEIRCAVPEIADGYVTGDMQEYKEDDVLHYNCDRSYERSDTRPSKCTKQGIRAEWIPEPMCVLITCKLTLPPLEGTRYEPNNRNVFPPGNTLRVFCGEKYWISNHQDTAAITTCKDDGQWSIRPVCQEVRCRNQRPQHVYNWDVYWGQTITLDETTRYWCSTGYKKPEGVTLARCTRDGWYPDPLCQAITCNRKDVENAEITRNDKQTYRENEQVGYTCNDGYRGRFTLTCREYGWSGNPQCPEITCRRQYYQNSDIVGDVQAEYRYNEQVKYTCGRGHEGSFILTCGETGWSGSPLCTKKMCKKLHIENAYIVTHEKETYSDNERVQYACRNDGERRFTVTCQQSAWTGIESCTECSNAEVENGFVVGPYNQTVYYTCNEGYKLFTKGWWGEATCSDGTWSGLQHCIENKMCGEIPVIPNAEVTPPRGQSITARIRCNNGYRSQIQQLTCQNGKWLSNGFPPKAICTPTATPCRPPPKVEHAVVLSVYQKEYLSGTPVTYQCRDKSVTESKDASLTIRCNNGQWETTNIKCTPYCEKLNDATMNFTTDKERYNDGEVIKYQCVTSDVKGIATCVNTGWKKSAECEAPTQEQ